VMAFLGRSSQAGETSVMEGGGGKMGQLLQYNRQGKEGRGPLA
jgi:hypothetical protein